MSAGEKSTSSMQHAFQQFMLQGKSNQLHQTSTSTISPEDRLQMEQEKQQENEINKLQSELKKGEKHYWSVFHRFCNILQNQWIDIDDQSFQVIESISSIRQRLPLEMKMLQKYQDETFHTKNEWQNHAHHQQLTSNASSLLSKDDIELALTHDLQQHEKMMEGLRSLFASLSEMHESMSRTLDDMMKHQLNQEEQILSTEEYYKHYSSLSLTSYENALSLVDLTTDIFHMFSSELYRKQSMVQYVLNSADDRILSSQKEQESNNVNSSDDWCHGGPKTIIVHCLKYWPRSSSQSCINTSLYDFAINKHEVAMNSKYGPKREDLNLS